jgi:uncharacterized protein (TIGR02145 family)
MRKLYSIIITVLISVNLIAQLPQKMSYQSVIRNSGNQLVTSHAVGMRVSILQGSATGTAVYVETQTSNTNANGLVTIEIGGGTPVSGTFAAIDWSTGTYFIKTETDPTGGTSYTITGTSQLLSVPYALYAENINLSVNSRPSDLHIKNDGSLWVIPKISVEQPFGAVPSVTDIDGNSYGTVKIGTQVWMAENLKTTKYRNGDLIGTTTPATLDIVSETTPKYQWAYDGNESNTVTYGRLYTWYAVTDSRKICPTGWHVPSLAELKSLTTYLGSLAFDRLRETGSAHWQRYSNVNAINDSKFTALPSGYRASEGIFGDFSNGNWEYLHLWNSTDETGLSIDYEVARYSSSPKSDGFSVRCLRD